MAKLKLQLEDLTIDSFQTTPAEKPRGTVFGEQCTCWTQCGQNTCPGCPTCGASCNGTCDASACNGSCAATCDASCNGTCECSGYNTCQGSCDGTCRFSECDYTCYNGVLGMYC